MTGIESKLRRWADRALSPFLDLRPGEGLLAFSMASFFFLIIGSYYLIKPVRNALFVQRVGADNLPFVYIGTAVVIGVLISWYSRHVVDRVHPRRLIPGTYLFLAGSLVVFWWLLHRESLVTSAAFYIWVKIYSVLVVSQFWLTANALFEPRQAKRLFGFVGAGGILGGIVGGTLAGATAVAVGTENLLLASAAVVALCAVGASRLQPSHPSGTGGPAVAGRAGRAGEEGDVSAAQLVRRSTHLRTISAILMLTIVVSTIVDWQMNKAVEIFIPGEDAKTAFYGRFFAVLNGASLLVQVLLTGYVLRRFGIGIALLLLPLGLLTGSLGILLHPALWTAALAKGVDGTFRYSLDQSTRELLFLPVPHEIKVRAKPFVDVAVQRGGTGVAGILVLLAAQVAEIPFHYVSLVSVAGVAAWISLTFVVRREYVASIKRLIATRDVEVEELVRSRLDADHRRELLSALESEEPNRVLYALELLELTGEIEPEAHVSALLRHPSYDVRERVASALAAFGDEALLKAVQPLLEDEDVGVRADAVRIVCAHCLGDELVHLQRLLSSPSPRVQAGAIAGFYADPDRRLSAAAEDALQKLATQPGPEGIVYRREAALLTALLPRNETTGRILLTLLADPDENVRRAAIAAAGRAGYREAVPALLRMLAVPSVRADARDALAAFGERVLGTLADYLRDRSESSQVRREVARVFALVPSPLGVRLLLEALDEPDSIVRYHVLKSLDRLRRDHPRLTFRARPVERALHREIEDLMAVQAIRSELWAAGVREDGSLWQRVLAEREDDAVERITRCLGLLYPLNEVFHAYRAIATGSPQGRSRGIELLDNVMRPAHRRRILPLLERLGRADGERGRHTGTEPPPLDPWLAACVAWARRHAAPESNPEIEDPKMLTIVERAEFLKDVPILSLVRTDYLAKIAAVTTEQELEAGALLFEEGDAPDAVYFVVEGDVRATRAGEEMWAGRRGEALGILAVLDRHPNPVTARCATRSRILVLEDEVFTDLMMDNPALMLGIIRFLVGEVRRLHARAPEEPAFGSS